MNYPVFKHLKWTLYIFEILCIIGAFVVFYIMFPKIAMMFNDFLWDLSNTIIAPMMVNL